MVCPGTLGFAKGGVGFKGYNTGVSSLYAHEGLLHVWTFDSIGFLHAKHVGRIVSNHADEELNLRVLLCSQFWLSYPC